MVRENNTVSGGIANSGTISAVSGGGHASGIFIGGTLSGGIANSGTITAIGGSGVGILVGGTLSGGIANSGTITASAPGGNAVGIRVGTTGTIAPTSFSGGITNAGTITATGKTGIGISVVGASTGGITNNGTITGSTSAIDLTQEIGGATVVTQAAGALVGSVLGSGNANADVLNFTGGRIVLSPAQSVAGFGSYTQTGGTLVLGVTGATTPGSFASVSAGTVALRGGALQLVTPGNLMGFTATQTYRDIISATNSLSGSFASVTTTNSFFTASVSPDATTPNALDATLSLSPTGLARLAPSAQDLTQNLRLGLDAPQVLGQAVEDRLIASGGVLSEGAWDGADVKGPVANATPIGHANLWVRGADQFGSASGHGVSPSYDVNRAAPLIGGVDWRFDHGIVAGVAATYVATSASFKDGSRTSVNSYQGAAYAGWAGGPWYALGSAVVSVNDFATGRLLTSFGFPGAASSSPSGQSYAGYAEAGYRWLQAGFTVTPYAGLGYVHASIDSFNETGAFGLSVNGADGNSFVTTLGVRATTRISWGDHAILVPELRLGRSHEFLDASQMISASVIAIS